MLGSGNDVGMLACGKAYVCRFSLGDGRSCKALVLKVWCVLGYGCQDVVELIG
jgi:hypothetical protein